MALKDLFSKNHIKKKKYAQIPTETAKNDVPEGIMTKCTSCKKIMYTKELMKNLKVCLHCGHHFPMNSKERIDTFIDEGSFMEMNDNMISKKMSITKFHHITRSTTLFLWFFQPR